MKDLALRFIHAVCGVWAKVILLGRDHREKRGLKEEGGEKVIKFESGLGTMGGERYSWETGVEREINQNKCHRESPERWHSA